MAQNIGLKVAEGKGAAKIQRHQTKCRQNSSHKHPWKILWQIMPDNSRAGKSFLLFPVLHFNMSDLGRFLWETNGKLST